MSAFNLTDEQKAVIEALHDQKRIKVNAFAGTGKTTTLLEMIRANPDKRFLYLVFNRRNREEAQEKLKQAGIRNADVYTIHSYAYNKTKKFHNFRVKQNKPNAPTIRNITGVRTLVGATIIWDIFNTWLVSDYTEFSQDVIAEIARQMGVKPNVFKPVEALKIYMEQAHITHDLYLKFFQMHFNDLDHSTYDVVLLDEAQDSNPITLWLFERIRAKQRVLVGDVHQQIYGFRGSVNAMQNVQADVTLPLTASFRFGPNIANIANHILRVFKAESHQIRGMRASPQTRGTGSKGSSWLGTNIAGIANHIFRLLKMEPREVGPQKAIGPTTKAYLSRTNGRLIQVMDDLRNTRWRTIRQPEEIFAAPLTILAIVNPSSRDEVQNLLRDRIYSYLFLESALKLKSISKKSQRIEEILKYADEVRDTEIYMAAKMVERFNTRLLTLFKLAKQREQDKDAPLVLTTVHTAKGLEWDHVQVEDDFPVVSSLIGNCKGIDSLEHWHRLMRAAAGNPEMLNNDVLTTVEEINLLYVAATRATSTLAWPYQFSPKQVDAEIRTAAINRQKRKKGKSAVGQAATDTSGVHGGQPKRDGPSSGKR